MRFRDTPEGRRQRDVLRSLEQDSGRARIEIESEIFSRLAIQSDQYRRYLRGDTPLRWDQIATFARALRTTTAQLTTALGLMDDQPDTFDARAYLRGRLQESDIDAFILEHGDAKPEAQRKAADGMLEMAEEVRRGDPLPAPMNAPNSSRRDQPAS